MSVTFIAGPNFAEEALLSQDLFETVLANLPQVHQGDAEVSNEDALKGSWLTGTMRLALKQNSPGCYGIALEVAKFLYREVAEGSRTLETGSGLSTIVFALRKSHHTVVTPSQHEAAAILEYARTYQIGIGRIDFVIEPSETYLPRCTLKDLDLVLIDGKHAVPWPFIDWFYTADRLKVGGMCVIDDIHLESALPLVNFLKEDPRWQLVWELPRRTIVFRKLTASVHNVSWHQQPYITNRFGRKARILNALGIKWRPKQRW